VSGRKKIEPGTTGLSITPPPRCVTTALYAVHAKKYAGLMMMMMTTTTTMMIIIIIIIIRNFKPDIM